MLGAVLIVGIAAAVAAWAYREHRHMVARRRPLLDQCATLFENVRVIHGGDGFPVLMGEHAGRLFDVRVFNDGMTIRRLPQLWLQVTQLHPMRIGASGFAVLVRPSGYEFFSLTAGFHHIIEVPCTFPRECIVRGESQLSERSFDRAKALLAGVLADPAVKEIALTCKGLRLIRQADEGRRGDYLLLRQAAFDQQVIPSDAVVDAIQSLQALAAIMERSAQTAPNVDA